MVKCDHSKEERGLESFLLKNCHSLITKGVDRRHTKIRGHKLFVNDKLHGEARSDGFSLSPSLGEPTFSHVNLHTMSNVVSAHTSLYLTHQFVNHNFLLTDQVVSQHIYLLYLTHQHLQLLYLTHQFTNHNLLLTNQVIGQHL